MNSADRDRDRHETEHYPNQRPPTNDPKRDRFYKPKKRFETRDEENGDLDNAFRNMTVHDDRGGSSSKYLGMSTRQVLGGPPDS